MSLRLYVCGRGAGVCVFDEKFSDRLFIVFWSKNRRIYISGAVFLLTNSWKIGILNPTLVMLEERGCLIMKFAVAMMMEMQMYMCNMCMRCCAQNHGRLSSTSV